MHPVKNAAVVFLLLMSLFLLAACIKSTETINRRALVQRHIPELNHIDSLSPFTVGNGEFAFTVDISGLQTFPAYYENYIPLGTQSQWGWHSFENPEQYTLDQTFEWYNTRGRKVPYAAKQNTRAGQWLRANPHRLHLGLVGFEIIKADGRNIDITDFKSIRQHADIWEGIVKSSFAISENDFYVETTCHPQQDKIASKITSEYLATGRVSIRFDFPYGAFSWGKKTADWENPHKHISQITAHTKNSVLIERQLDKDTYYVQIAWQGKARFQRSASHSFLLTVLEDKEFKFTAGFSINNTIPVDTTKDPFDLSRRHWSDFWQKGGVIDLSGSRDHRGKELERRIILSRYLTATQCAGSYPPAETGLTFNSWYGKFHLEMHWWHAVHFLLWGQKYLFERSMAWYQDILPAAREKARRQGYEGVRWPKMVACDGRESPSTVGVFLIWQQPHPIYYAELLYRLNPLKETLDSYKNIVFESAHFMASYAQWDEQGNRYILGPPLIPAQEIYKPSLTTNPGFELSYWKFGLQTAQKWRARLGMEPDNKWQHVLENLSDLPEKEGLYQNAENALDTFKEAAHLNDHPTLLASFGMLNNKDVNIVKMQNTLYDVMQNWNWENTWGWDYPLIAMTAARVGKPEIAIDALLMDVPKNTYLNNGHNWQHENLTIYLPGNGALLCAVAMMAAGWDGAPDIHAPGFPKNGQWQIKYEGLQPMP